MYKSFKHSSSSDSYFLIDSWYFCERSGILKIALNRYKFYFSSSIFLFLFSIIASLTLNSIFEYSFIHLIISDSLYTSQSLSSIVLIYFVSCYINLFLLFSLINSISSCIFFILTKFTSISTIYYYKRDIHSCS